VANTKEEQKVYFPDDWIMPDEFCFGPTGFLDTLRICNLSMRNKEDVGLDEEQCSLKATAAHVFRKLLAEKRRENGLPPLFWLEDAIFAKRGSGLPPKLKECFTKELYTFGVE